MKPKSIVKICLPNGKKYEMVKEKGVLTEEDISSLRELFGSASNAKFNVIEKGNDLLKAKYLVLWGDVLKNSWIEVDEY